MNFKKEKIKAQYIWVIDIWTYKTRVGICKILNRDVELIWYWEKRQDINDIYLQEIKNLSNVCENIKQAIEKAEIDAKRKIDNYIVNIPTSNLFFESSRINHIREKHEVEINENELYYILRDIETQALRHNYKKIKNNTGYDKNDLKLIISNISNLKSDWKITKNLIWDNPKEINISILNIFLTENKYDLKNYISKYIKKDIVKFVPSEFAILWLFNEKKDVVIIDLWNSHTSIIVKKESYVLWAKKLTFWINDFIKQVRDNYNLTKSEIIKKIDEDVFELEKKEFLEIFKDVLALTLEEILWDKICPENFFLIWWWANKFIKDFLKNTSFHEYELKMAKKIKYVSPKIDFIDDKITENPEWVDWVKSNINIYALIKATLDFIKKDKNKIERTIKEIIKEIN